MKYLITLPIALLLSANITSAMDNVNDLTEGTPSHILRTNPIHHTRFQAVSKDVNFDMQRMTYLKRCVGIARKNFVAVDGDSPPPSQESSVARQRAILLSRLDHTLHQECFSIRIEAEKEIQALISGSTIQTVKILEATAEELDKMMGNK